MAATSLCQQWRDAFYRVVQRHEIAVDLKAAAQTSALKTWTERLTSAVVTSCNELGWRSAAKGHLGEVLPVARHEYLVLDVVAFPEGSDTRWPFPIAVFELENSKEDDRVAYSLWKVLCIRAPLRVMFAYRRDGNEGAKLVKQLTESIISKLPISERLLLTGETSLVIGSRGEADTFPYGYFKLWTLNTNTGLFERV